MIYYKKTEEGEWIKYEERKWLAVLSWIWLIVILSLSSDQISSVVYKNIEDGFQTILFIISLFIFIISLSFSKFEHTFICWRHNIYNRPLSDYACSKAGGIFTLPYPKWFEIRNKK